MHKQMPERWNAAGRDNSAESIFRARRYLGRTNIICMYVHTATSAVADTETAIDKE